MMKSLMTILVDTRKCHYMLTLEIKTNAMGFPVWGIL